MKWIGYRRLSLKSPVVLEFHYSWPWFLLPYFCIRLNSSAILRLLINTWVHCVTDSGMKGIVFGLKVLVGYYRSSRAGLLLWGKQMNKTCPLSLLKDFDTIYWLRNFNFKNRQLLNIYICNIFSQIFKYEEQNITARMLLSKVCISLYILLRFKTEQFKRRARTFSCQRKWGIANRWLVRPRCSLGLKAVRREVFVPQKISRLRFLSL